MPGRRQRKPPKQPAPEKPISAGKLEPHLKYLAKVPREVTQRALRAYRLKDSVIDVISIICIADEISNKYARWRDFIHPLDPVSLDDLKNWFGVPNESARRMLNETRTLADGAKLWGPLTRVRVGNLPSQRSFEFARLDPAQQVSVQQMATNLLYGFVDPEEARRPQVAGVINFMLEQCHALHPKIFVAPNLIVCPDDEVIFDNIPVLYFDNILVYGDGKITTRGHTKINAQQIRHV
jgi:hypothetical protein